MDADFATSEVFRVVQLTPPGSDTSIIIGTSITAAAPGSADGLQLVVPDVEAARAELAGRGAAVDDVWHDVGGVFHHADGVFHHADGAGRVPGPAPDGGTYGSFTSFSDPDGNGWVVQEVSTRLPGRVGPPRTEYVSPGDLAQALGRAAAAHGEHEARTPTSLCVSHDGATIVLRDGNGELNILRLPRLELLAQKRAAPGRQTQFSRDGRRLFYGDTAGQVWTLDTRTWRPLGRPLRGGPGPGSFALSPGDDVLATSSDDGTTQLWDVASGRPIGTPLPGVRGGPARAAFVAGGSGLVTIGRDGRGSLWDLRPESWARRACAVAGRTLSRSEWRDALPERDYAPACRR